MASPSNRSPRAFQRLLAVAAIAVLAGIFACRPAWSPDSKRLLFSAVDEGGRLVACYDRASGKVERLYVPPTRHQFVNAMWSEDGQRAVILSGSGRSNPVTVAVAQLAVPATEPKVVQTVVTDTGALDGDALVAAIVVKGYLFFSTDSIMRVNLATGETTITKGGRGERLAVVRCGEGLGYVQHQISKNTAVRGDWEVGQLDPETLQRSPLLRSKSFPDMDLQPRPAFSLDLERIALPTADGNALVVFREGKVEWTMALGPKLQVQVNDIQWARHGGSLYASLCRMREQGGLTWSLFESTIGGSVQREVKLFASELPNMLDNADRRLGLAISPDGKVAALTTAYVPLALADHGLYLVDLTKGKRKVTKLPFPQASGTTIVGSDFMRHVAQDWAGQFRVDQPGNALLVSGGGSSVGLRALVQGQADLAMATRKASPAEQDLAKQDGITLEEHLVVHNIAAICVHKDFPIASLTVAQLAQIFGVDGVRHWSELGIEVPAADDDIIMATRKGQAASILALRDGALARKQLAHSWIAPENDDALVAYAASRKGIIVALDDPESASRNADVKVIAIARDAGSPPCLPTDAAIADGSYALASRMYVYAQQDAGPQVATFLRWLQSDAGREVTSKYGFRPSK
jgi:phosphate transport system substrate-binding protein